jgi:hypothetical protein
MDKCIRIATVILALSLSLILGTYVTSDSVAQSNATSMDNQSASTNSSGMVNQTAMDDQSSGSISGRH